MPCALAGGPGLRGGARRHGLHREHGPVRRVRERGLDAESRPRAVTNAAPEDGWPGTVTLTAKALARVVGGSLRCPRHPDEERTPSAGVTARWTSLTTGLQGSRAAGRAHPRRAGRRPLRAGARRARGACARGARSRCGTPTSTPGMEASRTTSAARQRTVPKAWWRTSAAPTVGTIASSEVAAASTCLRPSATSAGHEEDAAADAEGAREHARGQPERHARRTGRAHVRSSQTATATSRTANASRSVSPERRRCSDEPANAPAPRAGRRAAHSRRAPRRAPRRRRRRRARSGRSPQRRGRRLARRKRRDEDQQRHDDQAAADAEQRAEHAGDEADRHEPERAGLGTHRPILGGPCPFRRRRGPCSTARATEPLRAAVLLDVDGTLAPIVEVPTDAAVPEPTRAELRRLHGRYALVACVSGRPSQAAQQVVGVPELVYVGEHGLELAPRRRRGATGCTASPAPWPGTTSS